jgi:murein DD-endopeptidase / murein LD-carboxypeptidase
MLVIPKYLMDVRYNGRVHPRARLEGLEHGANCQVFAYTLLEHYGIDVPWLRSSELWEDSSQTIEVATYQPLDLLLFNASPVAFGAHVAVYVGEGRVVHLARHHGVPVIESIDDLLKQPRYRCFIGAKRVIMT